MSLLKAIRAAACMSISLVRHCMRSHPPMLPHAMCFCVVKRMFIIPGIPFTLGVQRGTAFPSSTGIYIPVPSGQDVVLRCQVEKESAYTFAAAELTIRSAAGRGSPHATRPTRARASLRLAAARRARGALNCARAAALRARLRAGGGGTCT